MILVGSQRGGAGNLARHLLNTRDNDHVSVHGVRGFMATDLKGALEEAHAVSKGTRAKQFMFSLSLNPPKEANVTVAQLEAAADRAEAALGLDRQPRAMVIHEKHGRRHAHVVWSRIDADTMTAINLPFFKAKLNKLAKELFLENGWELPDGFRQNDWKNPLNFTLAEWQKAERLDLDPRELKAIFVSAWARSDNLKSLRSALEEHGLFLAKGDRRGLVAVDVNGEVFSLARWAGVKTKVLRERFGEPQNLPSVDKVLETVKSRIVQNVRDIMETERERQQTEYKPLARARNRLVREQRRERRQLDLHQDQRHRAELFERSQRFRRGIRGVIDILTGRARAMRRQNARETLECGFRDADEREALVARQLTERRELEVLFDRLRERHREQRLAFSYRVGRLLRLQQPNTETTAQPKGRRPDFDLDL